MHRFARSLQSLLDSYQVPMQYRQPVKTLLMARVVGYNLPIPTSEVGSATSHYNENFREMARDRLAAFNELSVIDCDVAMDLTRHIWLLRYRMVHVPSHPTVLSCLDSVLVGPSGVLPERYREVGIIPTVGMFEAVSRLYGEEMKDGV